MSAKGKPHPKDKFTPTEDEKLKFLVKIFGTGSWNKISENMGKRNSRQCRDRYKNYLDPRLNSAPWTAEEDKKLENLIDTLGKKWSVIAKEFEGRTDINIKSRYMLLQRQKARERMFSDNIDLSVESIIPPTFEYDIDIETFDFDIPTNFM